MNANLVRLFLEVVDSGSLSKVAARRQTVQSHISRQVGDFEASMGKPLFLRTGRGVTLTEFGARAEPQLRRWLQETETLTQGLKNEAGTLIGEVRLGIIPSAAHPLMTRLFEMLMQDYPGIHLNIVEAQGTELNAMLDSGAVDLAVLFRYQKPRGTDETVLSVTPTYLVSSADSQVTDEPTVPFSRLMGLKLVLPRRPSHWRTALDEAARSLGFTLDPLVEADSLTVQKSLVAATPSLYTVMGAYSIATELADGSLKASRLTNPALVRHVTLALPRHGKVTAASRLVFELIEKITRSWGDKLTGP